MQIYNEGKIHVKSWCNNIEPEAMVQINNLANLPFAYHHIAIMPDCHCGYGMPIGSVLATKGVIVPNAVGVDIGCGMIALKTDIIDISIDTIKKILTDIRGNIPVGRKHRSIPVSEDAISTFPYDGICNKEQNSIRYQMGTLGGGNHFIEFQKDEDGFVWVMIHSGSRNLGKKVADYYNSKAKFFNQKYFSSVPSDYNLAFLPVDSDDGQKYIDEMAYCVDFALKNREYMINIIKNILDSNINNKVEYSPFINIEHNYACLETHFGENVWVHRKGATLARKDIIGIIPGSQGSCSYIVRGLGNPDSFMSCSHGAGRLMSRSKARKNLNIEDEINNLNSKGIIHSIRNIDDLDEAPSAYKDIDEVMESQRDLVEIITKLTANVNL